MPSVRVLAAVLLIAIFAPLAHAEDRAARVIADHLVPISSAGGRSLLPAYITLDGRFPDLDHPQPGVTRAIILFHGLLRNAENTRKAGVEAIDNAGAQGRGTLLIVPQFLEQVDVDAHGIPADVLRWAPEAWMNGSDASNAPVSSFSAIDGLLNLLANRSIFPNLKTVIVAGHSAGGQLAQRYAVAGRGGDALAQSGVRVRYVIANPSSFVYFSPERPVLGDQADFSFAVPSQTCSGRFNRWKYGLGDPPPYLAATEIPQIEERYIRRDIIYLLGMADNDPNHPELDKSCQGELQGPYRFYRGKAFFRYLQQRHPEMTQQLWTVPGVAHDSTKMFNSACGLAALFDAGSCATSLANPRP
jgi:pimeloyl-ACP methyl ester carboxylesterase